MTDYDDISEQAAISASSYDTTGACSPNLCNPKEVVDNQGDDGSTTTDSTKWQTYPEYITTSSSCSAQWLNFALTTSDVPTGVLLGKSTVQYGVYSFLFDGNTNQCPTLTVTKNPDGAATTLSETDYTCTSTNVTNQDNVNRIDTFIFKDTVNTENVYSLNFTWTHLVPVNRTSDLCIMDVEELYVGKVNQTSSSSGSSSSGSSSNTGSSTLSGGAVAGVVIGVIAAVAIVGLFGILGLRRHNIERRKKAALAASANPAI